MFKKFQNPKLFLPLLLVIFSFLVYWFTKPPSILYIDSGTMIAASYSLGIPNPPGFPFYMMLSHLFSILPIFNVLTRLELFTIVFSVAALLLVYKIILLIIESDFSFFKKSKSLKFPQVSKNVKYFAAFFGAFSLAFSYEYWSQSQNTEAFIFTDFFLVLFIYIILLLEKKKNQSNFSSFFFKGLMLLAFLFGLAVGANPTIGVLVPGVLLVMFLNRKSLTISRILVAGIVFVLTTVSVYLYLPIRAQAWPFVNWGNPQTLTLFIRQIRGAGLNIYEPTTNSINGFTGSPVVFMQSISHFVYLLLIQFTPFLLPFIFLGAKFVYTKNKILFWFLLSVVLVDVIYSALYFSGNQEAWFIHSWVIFSIFIGFGFYFVYLKLKNKNLTKLLSLIALIPLIIWFIPLNRSQDYYTSDYGYNLYSNLDKNAILIGTGDFTNSLGYYLRIADKFRPDVTPITANSFYVNKWYRDGLRHASNIVVSSELEKIIQYKNYDEYNKAMNELIKDNIDKRPIYITYLTLRASVYAGIGNEFGLLSLDPEFTFIPNGLTLQVVRNKGKIVPNLKAYEYKYNIRNFPQKTPFYIERNYTLGYINLKNDYAYGYEALGDWYLDHGKLELAKNYYDKAYELTTNKSEILSRIGQYYGDKKEYDVARQYFQKALEIEPKNLTIRHNLFATLNLMGKKDEALEQYRIIQSLSGMPISEASVSNTKVQKNLKTTFYKNEKLNLSFSYPLDWELQEKEDGTVFLTNGKKDLSALNLVFFGKNISINDNLQQVVSQTPINTSGKLLQKVDLKLTGFNAFVDVLVNKDNSLSQIILISKGNWAWFISLDPGNSTSASEFYEMLNTFKPLY